MENVEELTAAERLEQRIAELEAKIDDQAKRNEKPKPAEFVLQKYDLNDNEQKILRFVSAGIPDSEALEMAGLSPKYISRRVKESVQFASAYNELAEAYDRWLETQLKFIMPMTWARIEDLLATDPTAFLEDNPAFARNVLQAQNKTILQLLRLNYAKEHKITVLNKFDDAILNVQKESNSLIVEALREFRVNQSEGTLDNYLPEKQIIDVVPITEETEYIKNPMDDMGRYKCLECEEYVSGLAQHLHLEHGMRFATYLKRHNIEPGKMLHGS